MRSFWRIFSLEWTGLVRSRTVALLLVASVSWMLLVPFLLGGDGTPDGAREVTLRYALGGVAALVALTLTAAATGSVARERATGRLQLTLVRPVRRLAVAGAKIAALASVAALVLTASAVIELARTGSVRRCRHVYRPALLSPAREAELLYDAYMADPETPDEARKAPKAAILRLLAQRAGERYQSVSTNDVAVWPFPAAAFSDRPSWIRLRVTNEWNLRDDVRLEARLGASVAAVSNLTQTVSEFPLRAAVDGVRTDGTLELANVGLRSVMLRPRRDVEVLVEADGFPSNLLRATVELVAIVTALIAFGLFLGCAFSRPVALFTVFVTIALSEMSPTVLATYSGELTDGRSDALALALTRFAATATRPVSSVAPLTALAADECVEPREVAGTVAADLVLLPLLLSLLSAFVLARKTEDDV